MTNALKNSAVGDVGSPALTQPPHFLESGAGTGCAMPVDSIRKAGGSKLPTNLAGVFGAEPTGGLQLGSCEQILWFSFFFDGTGNNLDADVETSKHSNVARLYRAHRGDENNGGTEHKADDVDGVYRFYIPGVGTCFPAIGDDGGSAAGLGAGAYGAERLAWSLNAFEKKIRRHIERARNRANKIIEVNISAFGFSRGAALARAFVHKFVESQCETGGRGKCILKAYNVPVRLRFLGLFDTVASVGLAMSANNMEKIDALRGGIQSHISTRLSIHRKTRPEVLAFYRDGRPGADPAPGTYDGHADWGKLLQIPEIVEDVRHFVAAHELRNSFPVDSISILRADGVPYKPGHFHEYVYPGVHSDVGGSYRPGEGGKNERSRTKLGLVPLRTMYGFAIKAGVPFRAEPAFGNASKDDFRTEPKVLDDFDYYISQLDVDHAKSIGHAFNAHMKLYYAWKFRSIRLKRNGDNSEAHRIIEAEGRFSQEGLAFAKNIGELQGKLSAANARSVSATWALDDYYQRTHPDPEERATLEKLRDAVQAAEADATSLRVRLLRENAKLLALPKTSDLPGNIAIYDRQLMADVQVIYDLLSVANGSADKRFANYGWSSLRPHYRVLMKAYEEEFIKDRGLKDERIMDFFEKYVHDSLAGFGKDATLPSDPRVIYLGADEKLDYATLNPDRALRHSA